MTLRELWARLRGRRCSICGSPEVVQTLSGYRTVHRTLPVRRPRVVARVHRCRLHRIGQP